VRVFQLTPAGAPGDLLGSGTSGTDGKFDVAIPASRATGPLLVTVTGQAGAKYLSESTGADVDFSAAESFNAAIDDVAAHPNITVSPLTEAAYQKLQQILTQNSGLAIGRAVIAANGRIASLFGVGDILADPAGDINYRASLLIIDQMIVDQGASANTVTVMNLVNQAFADVAGLAYPLYLQALNAAADKVKTANQTNTALVSAIAAIEALAANPPAELDFTDSTAPSVPGNLTATASALTATTSSVRLTWTASSDNVAVAGYDVFRNGVKIATVRAPGYTDPSVTPNISYTYAVIAFDAIGNRSAASSVTITPLPGSLDVTVSGGISSGILGLPSIDNVPPTAPVILSAVPSALTATTSSVLLSWSASTDDTAVTGYDVFRNGSKIATVTLPGYTDPSLAPNVSYAYTVVAFDAAGNRSPASNQLSVTPPQAQLDVTVGGQVPI
jgi:chitodextrinase